MQATTFAQRGVRRARLLVAFGIAAALPALAQPLINGCSAQAVAACGYASPENFTPGVIDTYLEDPARGNHPVPIRVRYPIGATGARPVVIWSHGGGTTQPDSQETRRAGFVVTHGQQGSVRRSESFARAGFVVIHIGRMDPPTLTPAQLQDCANAGVLLGSVVNPSAAAIAGCRTWTGFHIEGPRNVAFVAGLLSAYRVGMLPGFPGTLDTQRIVVGGWSGGSESAINIAGAYQRWSSPLPGGASVTLPPVPVPGVVAFFADSPRGPDWGGFSSGFQEDSSYGIGARPFLFNTARDDRGGDADGKTVSRTVHFFSAAKGGKVMSYSWTPAAQGGPVHGTMDIVSGIDEATGEPANGCSNALREAHCAALEQLGIAFLDAYVMNRAAALSWLASGNLKVLTSDRIELYQR